MYISRREFIKRGREVVKGLVKKLSIATEEEKERVEYYLDSIKTAHRKSKRIFGLMLLPITKEYFKFMEKYTQN